MATSTYTHCITWVLGASSTSNLRGLSDLSNPSATSNLRVGAVALDFAPITLGFAIESNRIESNRIESVFCEQNEEPHVHDANASDHMNQIYQMN